MAAGWPKEEGESGGRKPHSRVHSFLAIGGHQQGVIKGKEFRVSQGLHAKRTQAGPVMHFTHHPGTGCCQTPPNVRKQPFHLIRELASLPVRACVQVPLSKRLAHGMAQAALPLGVALLSLADGLPHALNPLADISAVSYLVFDASGGLVGTGEAEAVEDGLFQVTLGSDVTSQLGTGASKLEVVVVSKAVAIPTFAAFEFVAQ